MNTILRALKVLRYLADKPMKVHEVADVFELHKSTASRLLTTLQAEGFVRLNQENKYELGFTIFELAYILRESLDLRKVARPHLEELNKIINETVHLGILEKCKVVYLDKIDCNRSIRMFSRIGRTVDSYCTGIGKVLLAFSSDNGISQFLETTDLKYYTPYTITDKKAFLNELQIVKTNGYAWDRSEHEEDICCIACPIFDFSGKVVAGISISVTTKLTSMEKLASYIKDLRSTTILVSKELGFSSEYPGEKK